MKKIFPHICMDLSFIFLTLCVLDQINPPMHFLSRNIFKIPLMIYLILVIGQSIAAIAANRRAQRRKLRKAQAEKPSQE